MLTDTLQCQVDRVQLRRLQQASPNFSRLELAHQLNRSLSWVKKWLRRFRTAADPDGPDDPKVYRGQATIRKTPYPPPNPLIVERILDIRDQPPRDLRRVPGPRTIASFLKHDKVLAASQIKPPQSTSFI